MKMLVLLEVDVPKTIGETMQRTGFSLVPDGTCLQVKVADAPPIPQRKTKAVFVTNPKHSYKDLLQVLATDPTPPAVEPVPESK
jgi:hypothetical protein